MSARSAKNCWEYTQCGRAPGGKNVARFGVCKAATDNYCGKINQGTNAGRICWAVCGTLSSSAEKPTCLANRLACTSCNFFNLVRDEEGIKNFVMIPPPRPYRYSRG